MERKLNPLVSKELNRLNIRLAEVEFERDEALQKYAKLESSYNKLLEQLKNKEKIGSNPELLNNK